VWKIVFDLEVGQDFVSGSHFLHQRTQWRNIPLSIAKMMKHASLGFFAANFKSLTEGGICLNHLELRIQHQQRLTYRIDDAFQECGIGFQSVDIEEHQNRSVDSIVNGPVWTNLQAPPMSVAVLHLALLDRDIVNGPF